MSFGISVSDILQIIYIVKGVHKRCANARKKGWRLSKRLRYGHKKLEDLRHNLHTHLLAIKGFQESLRHQAMRPFYDRVDRFAADVRAGRREATVTTILDDDDGDNEDTWRLIRRQLFGDEIKLEVIKKHQVSIKTYI
ncbi:hypothetical protein K432DRAFT_274336, partial [Lepidopterella palustris CBS 459.81]